MKSVRSFVCFILFIMISATCFAQNAMNDWALIQHSNNSTLVKRMGNDESVLLSTNPSHESFNLYRNVIKSQLGLTCHFEMTCPVFMPLMFERFGLPKAYFLSADRLLRCAKISVYETYTVRLTAHGKIKESPEDFYFHQ